MIVAIPACNEERRIADCLSALAVQRTAEGAPLARGAFDVLVLANNCTDRTAEVVRAMELVAALSAAPGESGIFRQGSPMRGAPARPRWTSRRTG